MVHLGVGNFHRAHQAVCFDRACALDPRWGIVGASLRSPAVRDALLPQDFLYSVLEVDGPERRAKVVGALLDCIHAPSDPEGLLAALASPATKIVTLTVTEKGYCLVPATGELDEDAVASDLAEPRKPSTALGYLAEGLRRRRDAGVPPFAPLSCDNLTGNGHALRRVLLGYCNLFDADLAAWVEGEVAFPCSMVDRITPATTDADRDAASGLLGLRDECAVPTEPFSQWVLERFDGEQPPWDDIEVEVVDDVAHHEKAKLRVLNASHFALAFVGPLFGAATVHDCVRNDLILRYARSMLEGEVAPTLGGGDIDVAAYIDATLGRYENEGIVHLLSQIRKDGSQKIGPRVLGALSESMEAGRASPCLELAVAAWLAHWHACIRDGAEVSADPHEDKLRGLWKEAGGDPGGFISKAVRDESVFGKLGADEALTLRIRQAGLGLLDNPAAELRSALVN